MLEMLSGPDDVIALRVSEKITGRDLPEEREKALAWVTGAEPAPKG